MSLDEADQQRLQLLAATILAWENRGTVVDVIAAAETADVARADLQSRFGLSEIQAAHVLSLTLFRFSADAVTRVRVDYARLQAQDAE